MTDVLSLTTDNRCFTPRSYLSLYRPTYGPPQASIVQVTVELLFSAVQQPVDSTFLKVSMNIC